MAARRRRRWPWLAAAALLVLLAAWLMSFGEPATVKAPARVRLPSAMSQSELRRVTTRRTWLAPVVAVDAGEASPPPRRRDPMLAALPPEVHRVAMVAEVNGILNSELGPLLVDCIGDDTFDEIVQEMRDAGFDPRTSLDRIAFADDTLLVSGDFSNTDPAKLAGGETRLAQDYGPNSKLYELPEGDGGVGYMGAWKGQMLIFSNDKASLEGTIDRLDGKGPATASPIDESQAYGEVYGLVQRDAFSELLGKRDSPLGDAVRDAANNAMVHLDVSHDIGLVADVDSVDPRKGEELRRTLGAALVAARVKAQAAGESDAASLLDLAAVRPSKGNHFRVEAGLPNELAVKSLEECARIRREGARRRADNARGARQAPTEAPPAPEKTEPTPPPSAGP